MNRKQVSNRKEGSLRGNTQPPCLQNTLQVRTLAGCSEGDTTNHPTRDATYVCMYVCYYPESQAEDKRQVQLRNDGGGGVFDAGVS